MNDTSKSVTPTNFIRQIIESEIADGCHIDGIVTRFPPEPNGHLHIGHAKSMCLNFGLAEDFAGRCFLRFDDTNPDKESPEYVESIKTDVRWLGFNWEDRLTHASDYFPQLYDWAVELIENGKAFICSLSAEEIRASRGTLTEPGSESPFRIRSVAESLELFEKMRAGDFPDGSHVLRAKIDMAAPNIHMRDPAIYRIRHSTHHNTGNRWCIYPMYGFTHPLSDVIEGVTHSLCTLEFEDQRPFYDWVLDNVTISKRPRQIEFSRMSLDYSIMSKRLLTLLVDENRVSGWDDPRLPTLSGLRRRGYTPRAIRNFCTRIGVTKNEQQIEASVLENCVREDLDKSAPRAFAVMDPLKIVIENYPQGQVEQLEAHNHPNDPNMGSRQISFCREIYIDRQDFMEEAPKKFFRLAPGREVRLRYAYFIICTSVIHDSEGQISELRCSYDPESRGGQSPDGRKVKGTLHWVSVQHALDAEVRQYDRLFQDANPLADRSKDFLDLINPDSKAVTTSSKVEPGLINAEAGKSFQFERVGYFCVDPESTPSHLVFNRTVELRDSWGKKVVHEKT
ncbi:MAG TPA: glutamine--tRNA ligase/YqeY domain fusion protein [Gammaproteobacteria bacterium]|nr:glutamine--tRNA ligase/YqeY domain fusion protein [Gammaproteobacteria bacterium]HIM04332.1 glutamine--tRNA ligase/YqeY domain fusion protein [Gammaproteobacteria bacterium]